MLTILGAIWCKLKSLWVKNETSNSSDSGFYFFLNYRVRLICKPFRGVPENLSSRPNNLSDVNLRPRGERHTDVHCQPSAATAANKTKMVLQEERWRGRRGRGRRRGRERGSERGRRGRR